MPMKDHVSFSRAFMSSVVSRPFSGPLAGFTTLQKKDNADRLIPQQMNNAGKMSDFGI